MQRRGDWRRDFRTRVEARRAHELRQRRAAVLAGAAAMLLLAVVLVQICLGAGDSGTAYARDVAPPLPLPPPSEASLQSLGAAAIGTRFADSDPGNVLLIAAATLDPAAPTPSSEAAARAAFALPKAGGRDAKTSAGAKGSAGAAGFGIVPVGVEDEHRLPSEPGLAQVDTFDRVVEIRARRNRSTFIDVLLDAGVEMADAHAAAQALAPVLNLRQLKPGQRVLVTQTADGRGEIQLAGIRIEKSFDRDAAVARQPDGSFRAFEIPRKLRAEVARVHTSIENSVYGDATARGVPAQLMQKMIQLFSYDVDFQRDIQPGDSLDVMFDRYMTQDGRIAQNGDILYAELVLSGKAMRLYRFEPPGGVASYYDANGKSVRKALLRTPIDGAKITSGFGMRRHPLLGYSRMHRGVDFGAPTGTPIMAAGAGVIEEIGYHSGYGRYVRIKHTSTYETAYAHMSRFATGLRKGSRVQQHQVIGYVGQTGLATGPHLHFEVLKENAQINPVDLKLPASDELKGRDLARFEAMRVAMDQRLRQLPTSTLIAQRP